ncbi:hypothetical protein ITJ11_018570 (plasmid) [Clostridioides difficile]|uniref:hypothetical protein n=1 Tax=Clostridioides difficile TaxID=1496 RepID=UPI001F36439A|nr:hypothetical protein [Clostridioides difficile]MCI4714642.1 hypothetical protein [Clostridioides difficile]MCR1411210.1 hypothetical protein [Clostridioides difficile]MCR1422283.1 hypothetical protein [Clostridioides difficile]MCR1730462.1 hypothetical protein [Clostridioides difficile]MCW0784810.1 hypothetical protein [Clostridioides difficile]
MERKKHELTDQDVQRLIEGLRTDPKIREMILESKKNVVDIDEICEKVNDKLARKSKSFKIQCSKPMKMIDFDGNYIEIKPNKDCETRTSTRNKCEQFVEEKLAYRSYGFETPKYYAKLIADIIDILVYKNVPKDRICGVLYDVERVIPLVVTF